MNKIEGLKKVKAITGDPLICARLRELGLFIGQEVSVLGRAPFRGPYLIKYNNTVLALREEEFQCLSL
ncbi:MAG: ferrous iron transport protein A [Proteobacteria bacterium]|jgi:ferrous iron transport protein A|nr:ferrous iron transport protein A [Pseudomonadota bacterium]